MLDKLKDQVVLHVLKSTLARHMANTGHIGEKAALALIEDGAKLPGPVPPIQANANANGQFANVINEIQTWITNDLGPDLQLLVKEAPLILQLISIFGAL